jgi:hypothetical protein
LGTKQLAIVKVLKYYMNLYNFLKMQFLETQTKLEPAEISIILEMMVMNSVWSDEEALLKNQPHSPAPAKSARRESLI